MNRKLKTLSIILISATALFLIGFHLAYWKLTQEWKRHYKADEMRAIGEKIDSAPPLPSNFYKAYDIMFPGERGKTLYKMSWQAIISPVFNNSKFRLCDCILASYYVENKMPHKNHSFTSYEVAAGIANYTSELKCFDFFYYTQNLYDFSLNYLRKPFPDLTLEENIELLIRLRSPKTYEIQPELLKLEMEKFMKNN